jgi:phage terminase large subunit-like protein
MRALAFMEYRLSPPQINRTIGENAIQYRVEELIHRRLPLPDMIRMMAAYDAYNQSATIATNQQYAFKSVISTARKRGTYFKGYIHRIKERRL